MTRLQIAIVGAGIGSPASAIGLARNGHQVTIYERSSSTSEVGCAFRITPNSDRCLKRLGIDTIAGGAVSSNNVRMMDANGTMTQLFEENRDVGKEKMGTSVFEFRPQLNAQLMDEAVKSGVRIRTELRLRRWMLRRRRWCWRMMRRLRWI
jgi:2-polyprenyl-6-methoxyphenol hydroxylase-like FAD-dependent oxidoreductase